MDEARQIRFSIPLFFLIGSLAFGLFQNGNILPEWFAGAKTEPLLAMGAAIIGSTLPIGFLISALTFVSLPFLFRIFKKNFECDLSENALEAIWPQICSSKTCDSEYNFQATVTLDHELISPGVHS